jgi:hypothetical protein
VVVTARNDHAKPITHYQIHKHFPDIFDDIIFAHHYTEHHIPKSQLCKDIGARILIEDNIDYALEVAEHGIESFLLARPWNTWRTEECPHMTRVGSWHEIVLPA